MTLSCQRSKAQGVSAITPLKEIQIHGVVKTRLAQRKYQHYIPRVLVYDIFAGDGENVVGDERYYGSPIEIAQAIEESDIVSTKSVRFVASDLRQEAVDSLAALVDFHYGFPVDVRRSKAEDQIKDLTCCLDACPQDHAVLVVDPNGPGTMPFNAMLDLAKRHSRRVDLLINVSETALKRILSCSATRDKNWWAGFQDFAEIVRCLLAQFRQAWIRLPIPGDCQRWRLMCFWTFRPPDQPWLRQRMLAANTSTDLAKLFC